MLVKDALTFTAVFTATLQCAWNIHKQPKRGQKLSPLKKNTKSREKDNKIFQSVEIQNSSLNSHAPPSVKKNTHQADPKALSFPKTIALLKTV